MITFEYILTDPMGLHARPASLLVKEAKKHLSKITVTFGESTVEAVRMMALMRLGTKGGDKIIVKVEGNDEDIASKSILKFMEESL